MTELRRRVLTVDDERDVRFLCRANLEPAGFDVVEAENGADALRVLADVGKVDLILLDLMMPVMDGWELLDRLKADPELARIPVVLFSAWVRPDDRDRGLGAGAVEVVEKPFSPTGLVETILSALAA